MFEIGSAVVLGLVVAGLVTLVHSLIKGTNDDRLKVAACLGIAIVAVQLVAASDFASEQVVLDRTLNSLNFASQLVVSLLLAGVAAIGWTGIKAVSKTGSSDSL